jgi:hypothetical protein
MKGGERFQVKFGSVGTEVVESPESENWVSILQSIKKLLSNNCK